MRTDDDSVARLLSIGLGHSNLSGVSEMLKHIVVTMNACGAILWQVVPGAELDRNPPAGYLSVLADWFEKTQSYPLHNLPLAHSATGNAVKSETSVSINDVLNDERVYRDDPFLSRARVKTMAVVPISFRDGTRGALNLYRDVPIAFTELDIRKIEQLASVIPDLYQAIMDKVGFNLIGCVNAAIQKAEIQTSAVLSSKNHAKKTIQTICDFISESFQCSETSIFLEDPLEKPGGFKLMGTTWTGSFSREEYPKNAKVGLTGWVLGHAKPVKILDLDYFDRDKDTILSEYIGISWEDSLDFRRTGRKLLRIDGRVPPLSFMAAPIVKGKDVLGVIRCCAAKKGPYYFAERELTLLTYVAAQISRYWSNWVSLLSVQEENRSWQSLMAIIGQLNSLAHKELSRKEPDELRIFSEALRVTGSVIQGAEIMDVRLENEETHELYFAETHGPFWTEGEQSDIKKRRERTFSLHERSAGAHVFKTGEVYMMPDVSKDPYYSGTFEGINSMIVAPIKIEERTFGVLDIRGTGRAGFPPHAKSMAALLGQQLGLYHYLAATIRDLQRTQTEHSKNIQTLTTLQMKQNQIFENLKHQLYGPINHAHVRIQSLLKDEFPNVHANLEDGTISSLELSFLRIRGLFGRTRRVAKNTGFIADLARGKTPELTLSRIRPDTLAKALVNAANDNKLMTDPDTNIAFRLERDTFRVLVLEESFADYDLLEQALMNVVDNAFKYSSHDTEVRISGGLTGTGRFYISVSNEGTRIRSRDVARCVERGWRSEEAKLTTGEGSGIGLWIVNSIMKSHGGDLEIIPTTTAGRTEIKLIFPASKSR
jgi:signal transduction histidine kinase